MAAVPHMIQLAPIMDHFYPERIKKVVMLKASTHHDACRFL